MNLADHPAPLVGVAHDQLDVYQAHRYKAFQDPQMFARFPAMPAEHAMVMRALYRHGEEIHRQYCELVMKTNAPREQLAIVCPMAEVGPVAATVRWYGMTLRPEHSATGWRVIWERPVGGQV